MQRYTEEIARAWNITFPPGTNPELQLMGHLWEPLKVVHKPLFVHIASEMSVLLTHLALLVRFAKHRQTQLQPCSAHLDVRMQYMHPYIIWLLFLRAAHVRVRDQTDRSNRAAPLVR